jgi:hypothetical protein
MSTSSHADLLAEQAATIVPPETIIGIHVSQAGPIATVLMGDGGTIQARTASPYPSVPGDPVRLERRGGTLVVTGPAVPRSPTGRVTVGGSTTATVEYPNGSGITKSMPTALTVALNDLVLINWESGGAVIGKLAALPGVVAPIVPPAAGLTTFHPAPFTAIDSGTYYIPGSRWSTTDVTSVSTGNNDGAWFYGSKIKDTIPDAAAIVSVFMYLPLTSQQTGTPLLQLHTAATRPGGNVTFTGATTGLTLKSGWVQIPTTFIDVLKASDGGLGFSSGGYNIWRGVAADGLSGALDITYQA